jgi:hypothetical protein
MLEAVERLPPKKGAKLAPLLGEWRRLDLLRLLQLHQLPAALTQQGGVETAAAAAAQQLAAGGAEGGDALRRLLVGCITTGRGACGVMAAAAALRAVMPRGAPAASDPDADVAADVASALGAAEAAAAAAVPGGSAPGLADVAAAMHSMLSTALGELQRSIGAHGSCGEAGGGSSGGSPLDAVHQVVAVLADSSATAEGEVAGLAALRAAAWGQLAAAAAEVPPESYSHPAVSALLELQAGLAGGEVWGGWQPAGGVGGGGGGAGGGAGLLFARTMRVVGRHWPGVTVRSGACGGQGGIEVWI